jgi:DNA-binding CsgD family transcriptional regulator
MTLGLGLTERLVTGFLLFGMGLIGVIDFLFDLENGSPWPHLALEASFSVSGLFCSIWLARAYVKKRHEIVEKDKEIQVMRVAAVEREVEVKRWRDENEKLLSGLSMAIDMQFVNWKFSPAEKEIGLFLLKGFSLKEIADVRNVSEKTVRQQAGSIYSKSNTNGRSEFSAFFLEDLLAPMSGKG